jgi:hypothetical protein
MESKVSYRRSARVIENEEFRRIHRRGTRVATGFICSTTSSLIRTHQKNVDCFFVCAGTARTVAKGMEVCAPELEFAAALGNAPQLMSEYRRERSCVVDGLGG